MEKLRYKTSIKDWSIQDQPIQKIVRNGSKTLTNVELLTILIGKGTKMDSAFEIALQMDRFVAGELNALAKMNTNELIHFKGIGEQKAALILAAFELGTRRMLEPNKQELFIRSSHEAFMQIRHLFIDLKQEHAYCLCLNRRNELMRIEPISVGGLTSTVVDAKVVFQKAILARACSIILAHNHPSGTLQPSDQDIVLTKNIQQFGKLIDLPLLDHLILTDNGYFSLADEGYM